MSPSSEGDNDEIDLPSPSQVRAPPPVPAHPPCLTACQDLAAANQVCYNLTGGDSSYRQVAAATSQASSATIRSDSVPKVGKSCPPLGQASRCLCELQHHPPIASNIAINNSTLNCNETNTSRADTTSISGAGDANNSRVATNNTTLNHNETNTSRADTLLLIWRLVMLIIQILLPIIVLRITIKQILQGLILIQVWGLVMLIIQGLLAL
jgi:hypothetical protein